MDEVKLIQAIYCTKERRGNGKSFLSPIRVVTQVFDIDGKLIAESDPNAGFSLEDMADFVKFLHSRGPIDISESSILGEINEFMERKIGMANRLL